MATTDQPLGKYEEEKRRKEEQEARQEKGRPATGFVYRRRGTRGFRRTVDDAAADGCDGLRVHPGADAAPEQQ